MWVQRAWLMTYQTYIVHLLLLYSLKISLSWGKDCCSLVRYRSLPFFLWCWYSYLLSPSQTPGSCCPTMYVLICNYTSLMNFWKNNPLPGLMFVFLARYKTMLKTMLQWSISQSWETVSWPIAFSLAGIKLFLNLSHRLVIDFPSALLGIVDRVSEKLTRGSVCSPLDRHSGSAQAPWAPLASQHSPSALVSSPDIQPS